MTNSVTFTVKVISAVYHNNNSYTDCFPEKGSVTLRIQHVSDYASMLLCDHKNHSDQILLMFF